MNSCSTHALILSGISLNAPLPFQQTTFQVAEITHEFSAIKLAREHCSNNEQIFRCMMYVSILFQKFNCNLSHLKKRITETCTVFSLNGF